MIEKIQELKEGAVISENKVVNIQWCQVHC